MGILIAWGTAISGRRDRRCNTMDEFSVRPDSVFGQYHTQIRIEEKTVQIEDRG